MAAFTAFVNPVKDTIEVRLFATVFMTFPARESVPDRRRVLLFVNPPTRESDEESVLSKPLMLSTTPVNESAEENDFGKCFVVTPIEDRLEESDVDTSLTNCPA